MHIRPRIRLTAVLGLLLALAALVALPSQTLAQAHKPGCPTSSSSVQPEHAVRGCAPSTAATKTDAQTKARAKAKARRRRRLHRKKTGAQKNPPNAPGASTENQSEGQTPAVCEDGTAPVSPGGSFECDDSSEPSCPDGSTPVVAGDGSALACDVASDGEASE